MRHKITIKKFFIIDFTYGYGELSKGQYRLVKDDLRKSVSHDSSAYSVYAEFEIL